MKSNIAPWNMMVGRQAFLLGVCLFSGAMSNVWGGIPTKIQTLGWFSWFSCRQIYQPHGSYVKQIPPIPTKILHFKNASSNFRPKNTSNVPPPFARPPPLDLAPSIWCPSISGGRGVKSESTPGWFLGTVFFFGGVGKKRWKKGINMVSKDFWNFAEIFLSMRANLDGFLLISGEQNELE